MKMMNDMMNMNGTMKDMGMSLQKMDMYPEISVAAMKMDEIQWCEDENGYEKRTIPLMLFSRY
jgi:hypothetical protein